MGKAYVYATFERISAVVERRHGRGWVRVTDATEAADEQLFDA